MIWLIAGLAVTGWALVLFLWLTLPGQTARREKKCVGRLRNQLEPYLKRRATEIMLLSDFPETTLSQSTEQVVDTLCQQVATLQEHDRSEIATSDTLPIDVSKLGKNFGKK